MEYSILSKMTNDELLVLQEQINLEFQKRKRNETLKTALDRGYYIEYPNKQTSEVENLLKHTIKLPIKLSTFMGRDIDELDSCMEIEDYNFTLNSYYSNFEEMKVPDINSKEKIYRESDWEVGNDCFEAIGYQLFTLWSKPISKDIKINIVLNLIEEEKILYIKFGNEYFYYRYHKLISKDSNNSSNPNKLKCKLKCNDDEEFYLKGNINFIPEEISYFRELYVFYKKISLKEHEENLTHMVESY